MPGRRIGRAAGGGGSKLPVFPVRRVKIDDNRASCVSSLLPQFVANCDNKTLSAAGGAGAAAHLPAPAPAAAPTPAPAPSTSHNCASHSLGLMLMHSEQIAASAQLFSRFPGEEEGAGRGQVK